MLIRSEMKRNAGFRLHRDSVSRDWRTAQFLEFFPERAEVLERSDGEMRSWASENGMSTRTLYEEEDVIKRIGFVTTTRKRYGDRDRVQKVWQFHPLTYWHKHILPLYLKLQDGADLDPSKLAKELADHLVEVMEDATDPGLGDDQAAALYTSSVLVLTSWFREICGMYRQRRRSTRGAPRPVRRSGP